MKRALAFGSFLVLPLLGCSSDDSSSNASSGGTGGKSGSGGSNATGGKTGTGGNAGNGGTAGDTGGSAGAGAGGGTGGSSVIQPPAPAEPGKSWVLSFAEEFDGADYDHSKLSPCFDWNTGSCTSSFNNGYEHYDPGQVQLAGGIGKLIAEPLKPPLDESACYQGSCTYKSGLLSTCRADASDTEYLYSFTYGYVEASLKIPGTQGFFTAFWMLPAEPSYDYATEIDILEALGHDPTDMEMHYHYANRTKSYSPNGDSGKNGACADLDYSQGQHRFGVDWEPTHVAFYVDGVKCGEFTDSTEIEKNPMQIILNHMVSVNWQRDIGKPLLDDTLVRELDVDYIRVFQQK
jgi:hypothetical protein